jgi:hypothetical protein
VPFYVETQCYCFSQASQAEFYKPGRIFQARQNFSSPNFCLGSLERFGAEQNQIPEFPHAYRGEAYREGGREREGEIEIEMEREREKERKRERGEACSAAKTVFRRFVKPRMTTTFYPAV